MQRPYGSGSLRHWSCLVDFRPTGESDKTDWLGDRGACDAERMEEWRHTHSDLLGDWWRSEKYTSTAYQQMLQEEGDRSDALLACLVRQEESREPILALRDKMAL
ncbi:hypothetical protein NDU88_010417 [Pleurodeles waltl]|uniref:MHC class I antigen n=1 Tax=Pleurodeles waltl TaxID=8319 RepID=A0AAV7S191_PLEWA|nr:hypothetical protein NDU88_010417 [Pleurodeles waltl]